MKAINLKTEYLTNPIGIDIKEPRLSWNCEGGLKQTAYRIIATTSKETVWDSGKVSSSQMTGIVFPVALISRQRVEWKVTLWDENEKEGEPSSAFFEMGLLSLDDFKAKWIAGNYRVNKKKRYPVDCFRKEFSADNIHKARLYITACGLYEAKLNGNRIGDFVLAPGYTDYRKRVQMQTYDVTQLLQCGKNEITVQHSDGWYRGSTGAWGLKNQYGKQTKLFAQLEIIKEDKTSQIICTDESWQWSNDGAITFADNKDGEVVDANKEATYQGKAKVVNHNVLPSASNNVFITEHEKFKPTVITMPSGKKVLDFGQNIAGYCSFVLNAHKGQSIRLRFGELLDENGEFTQKNIQLSMEKKTTPLQQIIYTCKEGVNEYKPTFTIFGFQYVLIETDIQWNPEDFTAIAVYSNMAEAIKFASSNELLNKFVTCTMWSAKNNHADVPTDCPTRERHGWTGDAQIFFNTASYLLDYAAFAKKYLRDVYDWQKKNGRLPQIAPAGGVDFYMAVMNGSVGWADAGIIIPYEFWKKYGDTSILTEYYDRMKKYAKFMIKRCGKMTILSKPLHLKHKYRKYAVNYGQSYGEWAEPADVFPNHWTDMILPHPEVSTAYTYYMMTLMTEIAKVLGKEEDALLYQKYAKGTKQAYQAMRKTKAFPLDTDRQALLVRPLYLDLLEEKDKEYAKQRLIKAIQNYGWRLGTGFLSTPHILNVLSDIDVNAAYKLLENEEMPGWLFMPKSGATTIWESWEGTKAQGGIASLNHYSKGAVCEWIFNKMCGIQVMGENAFQIAPLAGGNFKYAICEYQSVYGKVISGWKKENKKIIYTLEIPANCIAKVILPNGEKTISSGKFEYIVPLSEQQEEQNTI